MVEIFCWVENLRWELVAMGFWDTYIKNKFWIDSKASFVSHFYKWQSKWTPKCQISSPRVKSSVTGGQLGHLKKLIFHRSRNFRKSHFQQNKLVVIMCCFKSKYHSSSEKYAVNIFPALPKKKKLKKKVIENILRK